MPAARTRAAGISPLNVKPVRLLEDAEREREVRLRDLRAAIDEGDASGDPAPLDLDHIVAAGRASRLPDPAW